MRVKLCDRSGFTLVETLLTLAMLIVLLAISVVAVLTYLRQAQITELDNAARSIYLAAQNRAVLLDSSQRLELLLTRHGETLAVPVSAGEDGDEAEELTAYVVHFGAGVGAPEDLLPAETIEPSLWEGDFYIVYEPESASVLDVFFGRESLPVEGGFAQFYNWRTAPRELRMKQDPMIGYYGSQSGTGGSAEQLLSPTIHLTEDDNVLRASVSYKVPQYLTAMGEQDKVVLTRVDLTYGGGTISLSLNEADHTSGMADDLSRTHTYTWVLDDPLDLAEGGEDHFSDLFPEQHAFGGDFTIHAQLEYTGSAVMLNGTEATQSGNSLFGRDTQGDTAEIVCLRHLQNLDPTVSGVAGTITAAEQTGDVSGRPVNDDGDTVDYVFRPIENEHLQSYNGQKYELHSLTVESESGGDAGLFAAAQNMTFTGVRLVNTAVAAGDDAAAGALAGRAAHVTITDCLAYWEATEENTLEGLLTEAGTGDETVYLYQITGGTAGGLVGELTGATVTGSAAATLVEGGTAGGLAGTAADVTVETSYADCYLSGENAAGGLFGAVSGNSSVTNAYAAGFIFRDGETATADAFWPNLPEASAAIKSAYAAVEIDGGDTTFRLMDRNGQAVTADGDVSLYDILTTPSQWRNHLGNAFTAGPATHPYNLGDLALTAYEYPGLSGMDHYGDWSARFSSGALVYYEQYGVGIYGFMGGNVDCLRDDLPVVMDGYAMAYDKESAPEARLSVTYQTGADTQATDETEQAVTFAVTLDGENTDITLLPLPDEAVNTPYASDSFYQWVRVDEDTYFYNPHFPMIPLLLENEDEDGEEPGSSLELDPEDLTVSLRAPRHLYQLSLHGAYFSSVHRYRFVQELDLDYGAYTGYGLFTGQTPFRQAPVGSLEAPFRGSYNGGSHTVTGVLPRDEGDYVGLFGYSEGTLRSVVYEMTGALSVTAQGAGSVRYAGGLVGGNAGTVENCAVYGGTVRGTASDSGTLYLGGLAGRNLSAVRRSAAEGAELSLSTNFATARGGGFVGRNESSGQISQSYAVGLLSASQGQGTDALTIAGFSGAGGGEVSRSYAAMALVNQRGEPAIHGFSPTQSTGCLYLDNGSFTYREHRFTALYEDGGGAASAGWGQLAGEAGQTDAALALGMGRGAQAVDGNPGGAVYPLPAAVTDGRGEYVHYGQWPERLPLGGMGVFYWEALDTVGADGKPAGEPTYHLSAIAADLDGGTVQKISTLSAAHDDGKVVTDYGYGWYRTTDVMVTPTSQNISWSRTGNGADFDFTQGTSDEANEALEALMGTGYEFHCYRTIDPESGDGLYRTAERQAQEYELGTEIETNWRYNDPPKPSAVSPLVEFTGDGVWTLKSNEGDVLSVQLDPFFADAMSLGSTNLPDIEEDVLSGEKVPGSDGNPYEIRSIEQLRFINWNAQSRITDRVLTINTKGQFPYLYCALGQWDWGQDSRYEFPSYHYYWVLQETGALTVYRRDYHWTQTHDISGGGGTYTPIAEFYDQTGDSEHGTLSGWFGGTYDGDGYMIEDVNIQGGDSSCAGLFGAVFNGTLKDIILYSETGATVTSRSEKNLSNWYGIGGLVGVAGSTDPNGAIQNCAVAGYTIVDNHEGGEQWGGAGIGGLAGICDMSLSNCTAVTTIRLGFTEGDNVRVGGLVGTCQGTVSSCYSGGTVQLGDGMKLNTPNSHGVYIGGITGGMYMKPLNVAGTNDSIGRSARPDRGEPPLELDINNCYSYVELPNYDGQYVKGVYAIGGTGDINTGTADKGVVTYDNNYYLAAIVFQNYGVTGKQDVGYEQYYDIGYEMEPAWFTWKFQPNDGTAALPESDIVNSRVYESNRTGWWPNYHYTYTYVTTPNPNVTAADYANLAGTPIGSNTGGAAYNSLTAGDYEPITALNGRYSFSSPRDETTDAAYMERYTGLDYPFPAILTQDSELTDSGTAYVHYGWWPLRGIVRQYGSGPIQLDLFSGGGTYSETLSLSSDLGPASGGAWTVSGGDGVVEATLSQNSGTSTTLTVTALQPGETALTVSCGGESVTIPVTVTAELGLRAAKDVVLFPGETAANVPLTWVNGEGTPIADDQLALIQVVGNAYSVSYDPDQLTGPYVSQVDGKPYLTVTAGGQGGQSASLTVSFRFTVGEGGPEQSGSGVVHVEILDAALSPADTTFTGSAGSCAITGVTVDGQSYPATVRSVRSETAGLVVTATGNQLTFTVTDPAPTQGLVRVTVKVAYGDETRDAVLPLAVTITPQTP